MILQRNQNRCIIRDGKALERQKEKNQLKIASSLVCGIAVYKLDVGCFFEAHSHAFCGSEWLSALRN